MITMAKQVMLIDSQNMAFKTFRLEVVNKKPLSAKPTVAQIEILLKIDTYNFLRLQNFVPQVATLGKLCLL